MSTESNNRLPVTAPELQPRNIPTQKRSAKTVRHILDTSAQLLDEVGFDSFNTNLLAERANLRIGTIYRYFPNKMAILTQLAQEWYNLVKERVPIWDDIADPSRDWRETIIATVDTYYAMSLQYRGFLAIRTAIHSVPEAKEIKLAMLEDFALVIAEGMKARGVAFPKQRLFITAGIILNSIASNCDIAHFIAKDDKVFEKNIIDEIKISSISYLANYLD